MSLFFRPSGFVYHNIFHEQYILFTSSISILLRQSDILQSKYVFYRFVLNELELSYFLEHEIPSSTPRNSELYVLFTFKFRALENIRGTKNCDANKNKQLHKM